MVTRLHGGEMTLAMDPKQNIQKNIRFGDSRSTSEILFDFLQHGSWRPLDVTKAMSEDRGCANVFHYREPHSENLIFPLV